MITVTDLTMNFGGQTLFTDVNLRFDPGKRYGIVGANGSGKSTLLRILAEQEPPSKGDVQRPKKLRLGVLEQDHFQYEDVRILDVAMMGNRELWDAMIEKEAVLAAPEFDDERYGHLEDVVLRYNGYELEARAGQILEGLGIPTAVHEQPLSVLSGGFKLRALLARTLASEPDLLFLDEPTNHLDILAIKWLEEFLVAFPGTTVVVSHDLRFLDNFATHILDVDYQRVALYKGDYTDFTRLKEEERLRQETEISKREKEMSDHKAFIARFKAKASKARQANSRQKRLEKIEIEPLPTSSRRYPRFKFRAARPSGREVLTVTDVRKAYGEKVVLDGVSFTVERGDRLAVIGPNGVGKSTLLNIAMGLVEPDAGTATWGYEATPGWFPQNHDEALGDPAQTVQACMWDVVPDEGLGNVLARLATVLLSKDDSEKAVGNLSGGEAARLLFARIAALEPTVLVLDEPTNHLDLEGISALAQALKAYDGTLIFVSHDRWFVNELATRVLEIRPDGIDDFKGSYADFLRQSETDHLDAEEVIRQARGKKR
ncbi:MAG: ABC-F family ATP-binding cassette domain-containing protein [Alphaproteobacteria bacterium]|nr:ABC-F family ATP-binding cassette domain-containing protein [Alphaproteobacteria bacterium]MCB9673077.1 ABC-F family ATP-binding cassette domain-containing protein [Alphaproteobacteria bacterium]MCB9694965.1 ABC-F family ATP-binding cassette domain-containing protein [Alphaproteobacteria bacterium]